MKSRGHSFRIISKKEDVIYSFFLGNYDTFKYYGRFSDGVFFWDSILWCGLSYTYFISNLPVSLGLNYLIILEFKNSYPRGADTSNGLAFACLQYLLLANISEDIIQAIINTAKNQIQIIISYLYINVNTTLIQYIDVQLYFTLILPILYPLYLSSCVLLLD